MYVFYCVDVLFLRSTSVGPQPLAVHSGHEMYRNTDVFMSCRCGEAQVIGGGLRRLRLRTLLLVALIDEVSRFFCLVFLLPCSRPQSLRTDQTRTRIAGRVRTLGDRPLTCQMSYSTARRKEEQEVSRTAGLFITQHYNHCPSAYFQVLQPFIRSTSTRNNHLSLYSDSPPRMRCYISRKEEDAHAFGIAFPVKALSI